MFDWDRHADFYAFHRHSAWCAGTDIETLTDETRSAGPARKMKNLAEAFEESNGFTLEKVKEIQEDVMEVDEEAGGEDEMDIDEEEEEEAPSEEEPKPKKRGTKRKKTDSASDDEAESPKPAKTPKKAAAAKAKTPKTKTPKTKTPRSATNGVKASAKKAAKNESTPAAKKGKGKRGSVKSAEFVEDSGAESEQQDDELEEKLISADRLKEEDKQKVMMARRHKMQKCLLSKDGSEPSEKV